MIASCRTFSVFIAEESRGPSPNKPEATKPVRFAGGFFILADARTIAERFATIRATTRLLEGRAGCTGDRTVHDWSFLGPSSSVPTWSIQTVQREWIKRAPSHEGSFAGYREEGRAIGFPSVLINTLTSCFRIGPG